MSDQAIAVSALQAAIEDTQGAIRVYDVKAEILGALFIILLGVMQLTSTERAPGWGAAVLILTAVTIALGVACLGMVLMPRTKKRVDVNLGGYVPRNVFYPPVTNEAAVNVAAFAERARTADWVGELTFELFKLVRIRDRKERWFRRGMLLAGAAVVLAVMFLLSTAYGGAV